MAEGGYIWGGMDMRGVYGHRRWRVGMGTGSLRLRVTALTMGPKGMNV